MKKAIACIFAASIALTAFAGCSRRTPVYTPAPSPAIHRNLATPRMDLVPNDGMRGTSPYGGGTNYRSNTYGSGGNMHNSASPKVSPATSPNPANRVAPKSGNSVAPKSHKTTNGNHRGGTVTTSPAVR